MTTLHCSHHLRHALGTDPPSALGEMHAGASDNTRLGEWSATVLMLPPARLVLAVSEHAHLPVVSELEPRAGFPERLPEAIYQALLRHDIPVELVRRERDSLLPLSIAIGDSRSPAFAALRTLTTELKAAWDDGVSRSPSDLAHYLATLDVFAEDGQTPAQAVRRRFHLLPEQTDVFGL